jgi:Holliday junction resolvase RusA-like endonuclease
VTETSTVIELEISGIPAPKGSMTRMPNGAMLAATSKTGRIKLAEWQRAVADAARRHLEAHPRSPLAEPLSISMLFRFPATKTDPYRYHHTVKPDIDKLERSTLDALKLGGLIADDALVCDIASKKRFAAGGQLVGCVVTIKPLGAEESTMREQRKTRAALARKTAAVPDNQAALL